MGTGQVSQAQQSYPSAGFTTLSSWGLRNHSCKESQNLQPNASPGDRTETLQRKKRQKQKDVKKVSISPLEFRVWGQTAGCKGKDFPRILYFEWSDTGQKLISQTHLWFHNSKWRLTFFPCPPLLNSLQPFGHGVKLKCLNYLAIVQTEAFTAVLRECPISMPWEMEIPTGSSCTP